MQQSLLVGEAHPLIDLKFFCASLFWLAISYALLLADNFAFPLLSPPGLLLPVESPFIPAACFILTGLPLCHLVRRGIGHRVSGSYLDAGILGIILSALLSCTFVVAWWIVTNGLTWLSTELFLAPLFGLVGYAETLPLGPLLGFLGGVMLFRWIGPLTTAPVQHRSRTSANDSLGHR